MAARPLQGKTENRCLAARTHAVDGFTQMVWPRAGALFRIRRRYRAELAEHAKGLAALRATVNGRAATLITATREVDLSHAAVMREILLRKKK
jgi:hypothetical protein